jgi:energy-coupling factor transporter ATP-binding protein EcfA2
MRSLPLPETGGSFDDLYNLFDIDENGQKLSLGWLLAAYQPQGARAHLELCGQQGSGKTTFLRMLIRLIDPAEVDVRSMPKDEDALVIAVSNRTVLAFDNVSHLPVEQADAYCRVSTGGGLGKRALYTDGDEVLISVQIPLAWTGINSVIGNYADLQDRTVTVTLQPLDEKKYRPESDLWACFDAVHARLLGSLYDALSMAIRRRNEVRLTRRPRLADFTEWVEAAAPSLGWAPGEFLHVLTESRESASELAVESSPIGDPIVSLVKRSGGTWQGTATELLDEIRTLSDDDRRKLRGFPKQANQLSNALKRLRPALLNVGIKVDFEHSRTGRSITLSRTVHELARQQAQLLIDGGWAQVESLRADLATNTHLSQEDREISEEALEIAEAELRKAA